METIVKRYFLIICFMLLAGWCMPDSATANIVFEYPVASSTDDAEEGDDGPGAIDIDSSDLELAWDHNDSTRAQTIGIRFESVSIPKDATILDAYIQFACDEGDKNRNPFDVTISGEASDNAATYAAVGYNISSRAKTAATVTWQDIPDWTSEHAMGTDQRTPDLTEIIQEILSREGWVSGNSIAFVLEGAGTRTAESFDGAADHGNPVLAPTLVIVLPSEETYRVSSSTDDAEEGDDGPGAIDIDSSDLELAWDHDDPARAQTVGIRFSDVTIPKDAQILSAYVQFTCDEDDKNRNPLALTISGEAADDADIFTTDAYNVSGRTRTATTVAWSSPADWTVEHAAGPDQRTPDISPILQEIIDRDGWMEGNALALIFEGIGTRTAESFDGASDHGDPNLAPELVVVFDGIQATSSPSTGRYRLVWNDDPAATMMIAWDQFRGSNPAVYYGTDDFGQNWESYPASQSPTRIETYRGMNNHFAKLNGLLPDTAYYFVIKDSVGISERMWFKTAPDTPQPFTCIVGGDSKSSGAPLEAGRNSNRMVAKLRPLFVQYNGDFISGDGTSDFGWQQWFDDWAAQTKSSDGRMYPIVPVHGNHENGDLTVLHKLFDVPYQNGNMANNYYSLNIGGDFLHLTLLNTEIEEGGDQRTWLEQDLIAHQDYTFKFSGYHKPFHPHTSGKAENEYQYEQWAQLFYDYGMTISFDADSHMHKITFPVRPCESAEPDCFQGFVRDDENGTLFAGEGSWGAWSRDADDDKPWTLSSTKMQQFKWVHLYPATEGEPDRIEIRTVVTGTHGPSGELIDHVAITGENTEADVFAVPENITLVDIPFYGTVVHYPFQAVEGNPPVVPTGLNGIATSYTDIELSWIYVQDPAWPASKLELQRKTGVDGEWLDIFRSIAPEQTSFSQDNLNDGTEYSYRIRARNLFGTSDWSNIAVVATPLDERVRAEFQQGVDGYTGTTVVEISEMHPDVSNNSSDTVTVDRNSNDPNVVGDRYMVLMHFDTIFGPAAIPADAEISQALLRLRTFNSSNSTIGLYRMLTGWSSVATWNLMIDGVEADDVEAVGVSDDYLAAPKKGNYHTLDVTDSLLAWQDDTLMNFGWVFISDGSDGWDFCTPLWSIEEQRPLLTVYYEPTEPVCSILRVSPGRVRIGSGETTLRMVIFGDDTAAFTHDSIVAFGTDKIEVTSTRALNRKRLQISVSISPDIEPGRYSLTVDECVGEDVLVISQRRARR